MKWIFSVLVFNILLSHQSLAIVDLKNANFSHSWVDLEIPGGSYVLKIERTYNSRTLFSGIFGYGMCSDFETFIEITAEGNLRLKECGAAQEIVYSPREINNKEIEATVNTILEKVKAEKKAGATEAFMKQLKEDLRNDDAYRTSFAKKLNLPIKVKEGSKFYANGKEVEYFLLEKNYYTRHLADGSMQRFDTKGRLTHFFDKNNNFLKLEYDKDLISQVSDNENRKLYFKYYPSKKVKTITGPMGSIVEYKFSNFDDLNWVKSAWGKVYTYQYDDVHNMTKATWPDKNKTSIQIKYDKVMDWPLQLTDREGCIEKYKYEAKDPDPKTHYSSSVVKTCKGKVVADNRYEFWYRKKEDNQYYLTRVLSNVDGSIIDINYHEGLGKPVSIRKNTDLVKFDYYPDGLIKVKSTPFLVMNYEYDNKIKKVNKVSIVYLNEKGKKAAKKVTEFEYDSKGNIANATNSDGQKVNMTYDDRGRIATIVDQARKLVKIEYDEALGKPSIVTRPGVGSIKILYKPDGDINKVESKDQSVAMQVASTFNNLLDVIAPATQELYL